MDNATMLAIRAVVSGLRYSRRIDDDDCKAIIEALDEVANTEAHKPTGGINARQLYELTAHVARDCFSVTHPIYLAAQEKIQTD